MAARTAGGGRWEVVKKGRRPGAGGSGRGGGVDRRALGEANGVWKYDLTPPIQTTSTLYERGFEKIMKKQNKEQVPPPAVEPKKPGNKKQTKKVATLTNQNQKQGRFRSLEEALKALDVAALQKELDKSQSVFSGNPSVWLKDLASYLNYKLQAPLSEPTLSQHTHDYPYSLVSRELRGIIRGLLAKAAGSLELFFDHCLFTMLQELDKTPGESLHGYRICIQAILQDKPKIATMNLGKDAPQPHQGLWHDWPQGLLPTSGFCLYAQQLSDTQLLRSLTECLTVDPLSANVWRQLYPKHLSQSSLLLEHLLRSWERIPKKAQKSLQETIQSFKLTNQELLRKGSCNNQDVVTCDAACKGLLQQAQGFRLPWTRLLLLVLIFAIGFLCHDFRSHSSFQASLSGRLLQSSGLLPAGQKACAKIYSYSLQGYSWLEETLPAWGSHLLTVVRPSLQFAWTHINATVSFLSAHCASHLACFSDSLTSLSQRLQLPDALNQLLHSLRELLLLLYHNVLLPVWLMLLEALAGAQQYCHKACRGEVTWDCVKTQLSEAARWTWLCLQDITVAFLDWALAMISQQ
ncbi:transmembrane protein 214 isoform X3 [Molossus molossus]|uniref:transmembrane protein 214 isoform X3 n=1 Tax=Molossus molossus TaxID=27622 RepID=UPI0017463406|nr:transmembrane protein 214 isoform X3 [Molossus molossus]